MNNLYSSFKEALEKVEKPYNKIIFICIGTDRSTGDSYGPIVGSMLKQNKNIEVYGTLHEPVHAMNLKNTLENIELNNNLIIAVDAALGSIDKVKKIFIENKPIRPGKGVGKNLGSVGDISIKGIIGLKSDSTCFEIIQNTRLSVVYDLAKLTFETIYRVLEEKALNEVAVGRET
ncbi:spore protease YyaC [Clostridium sporogenes]|uniref:spore protease YyaC n=1 Tax=Clostridium sporogenes TaxID=1509 RepID=UPI0013D8BF41|nr:spore protease YyaC [Clostridium sporogenes]NFF66785.1 spore protease YyaC [Clostridium sporogenes]NFF99345.1 spore protease YyaC [Clostridium sporogenes]NFG06853.1 spore protease YyaC [Clostridium sporogenes]NFG51403.1 spore protease YyaC [Clostridium sporogenes]NFP84747.1 spore protease YyaC [Clostridium sporogenes]